MLRNILIFIVISILIVDANGQQVSVNNSLRMTANVSQESNKPVRLLVEGDVDIIKQNVVAYGGQFLYAHGNIAVVKLPAKQGVSLAGKKGIKRVEYHPITGLAMNDVMIYNNNVVPVHQGIGPLPGPFKGNGVILAYLDTGIDFLHPDFQNPDGSTRILHIWDQTFGFGPNTPPKYGYGQEWDSAAINAGNSAHIDPNSGFGHGSNVAGIGSGNGLAVNNYTGVAPESDIIAVKVDFGQDFISNVVDAVDYVFEKADQHGKPVVINASIGTFSGSHDGRDLASRIIDSLIDMKPGRVMVNAGGNSGDVAFHVGQDVSSDTSFTWFEHFTSLNAAYFQFWADTADFNNVDFSIGVVDPNGFIDKGQLSFLNAIDDLGMNDSSSAVHTDSIVYNNNTLGVIEIFIENHDGVYGIDVLITTDSTDLYWSLITTGIGHFDLWSKQDLTGSSNIVTSGLPDPISYPKIIHYGMPDVTQSIVGYWAASDKVIAVANYVNRDSYIDFNGNYQVFSNPALDIAPNSSFGPTRDGRLKPDLAASGNITLTATPLAYLAIMINNQPASVALGGMHRRNGGTSMASPVVAGISALYLERYPQANWREVKEAVTQTARMDGFTGSIPNTRWGHGKVDAFQALTVIKGCTDPLALNYNPLALVSDSSCSYFTGIDRQAKLSLLNVNPNPSNSTARISFNLSELPNNQIIIEVVNVLGIKVASLKADDQSGQVFFNHKNLPAGIYFVNLRSSHKLLDTVMLLTY